MSSPTAASTISLHDVCPYLYLNLKHTYVMDGSGKHSSTHLLGLIPGMTFALALPPFYPNPPTHSFPLLPHPHHSR
jgi:hypothetical protein